ncbi:MAG: transposase, partial [Bacillota bacterium]
QAKEFKNIKTGKIIHAAFPSGIVNESSFGPGTKALACMLGGYCNVSIDKVQEVLCEITGNKLKISKGTLSNLMRAFSTATEDGRNQVWKELLASPSLHVDATNARVNGKSKHVFVTANEKGALYQAREHKGIEALKGTPLEDYMMALVHDHDVSFYHYGGQHQECLSHVLRYLQDSIENEASHTWNKLMKELIQEMIHETKQSRVEGAKTIGDGKITDFEKRYDALLKLASEEYTKNPPTKYYRDGFNLAKRMKKYRKEHLLFLHEENVDYTNNLAERLLRQFKRKMKQSGTFRSQENLEYFCNMLSIIETTKMNSGSIYQKMVEAFQ